MKNINYYLLLACLLVFSVSCRDDDPHGNINIEEVRNLQVEPRNGGAYLSWTPPQDAIGVRIVFTSPSAEYPFFPQVVSKMFPRETTSFEIMDAFIDTSAQEILVQAVFNPNIWTDGVKVSVNPYLPFAPRVRDLSVRYYPDNEVMVTWEMPPVPDDMTLLGFRVVHPVDGGGYTEVELLYDAIEGFTLQHSFRVPDDIEVATVRIYAIYVDDEDNDRISRDAPILVVMLEPVPLGHIEIDNLPGGARIEWDAPEGRPDFQGVRVVFQYGPGGRFFELWRGAGANFVQLEGYSNIQPHMVALYAVYGRGEYRTEVTIQPEAMSWHGQTAFDMPGRTSAAAHSLVLWEQKDWGNSNTDPLWREIYLDRTMRRGDMFVPGAGTRPQQRGFQHINDNSWHSDSGAENQWNPGGDGINEFTLNHFLYGIIGNLPGAEADNRIPPLFPLYITFDMGRRAWHDRFAFLVRRRANGVAFPVVFRVWGTNEITPEETFNGDRIASLEYWTGWSHPRINGTDQWKNNWTLLAEHDFRWPDGPGAGTNVWPAGQNSTAYLGATGAAGTVSRRMFEGTEGPNKRPASFFPELLPGTPTRGLGFEFSLNTTGATGSYRFLRLEILQLSITRFGSNDGQGQLVTPNLQWWGLKFYGRYDEYWP